jgi:Protein of unknown function (DUF402)
VNKRFRPGDTIVLQEIWRGRVWAARPMRVVADEGESVALWFPLGTCWKAPTSKPGRTWSEDHGERLARCAALGEWVFRDMEMDYDSLWLMREGDWHAVWVSWLPGGEHWGWYVNLQEPFRRTPAGFVTMDLVLDVIVDPDRSWRWKDEDELETFIEHGVIDEHLAGRVRAEGLEVARRAELNEPPFSEPWASWRPGAGWTRPELPEGWDEPCL